jgi:Uma2 family endonuclease
MSITLQKQPDQKIPLQGTWDQFKLIQKSLENSPGIKLSYFNGAIEILMPGRDHEIFKSIIGMLLERFFFEQGIEFEPTGSMTQEKEGMASAQADESYCIGSSKPIPDLSIEVIFSSGGDKLGKYQALGVPEVWFWQDGLFTLHCLRGDSYERIYQSEVLPDLDMDLLTRCVLAGQTSRLEAAKTFEKAVRDRRDEV